MVQRSSDVDAYIARAPEFARPILARIRDAFHAGCPGLEERLKWGVPGFEYRGLLGGMAAFKKHVAFGFWKARLMADPTGLFRKGPRASVMGVRVEALTDLPAKRILVAYVKEAARLNQEGVKEPKLARAKRVPAVTAPPDLKAALAKNARAWQTFESLPPSHKRDYVEWITDAKRAETRRRRIETAVRWMAEGKRRNWKYVK